MRYPYHGNSWVAANVMAAQERREKDLARFAQQRLLSQTDATYPDGRTPFASIRAKFGSLLIRMGERIRGASPARANAINAYGQ